MLQAWSPQTVRRLQHGCLDHLMWFAAVELNNETFAKSIDSSESYLVAILAVRGPSASDNVAIRMNVNLYIYVCAYTRFGYERGNKTRKH